MRFLTDCKGWYGRSPTGDPGADIRRMAEKSKKITRKTFLAHVDDANLRKVERSIGYDSKMPMASDPFVGYYRGRFVGKPVYFFRWSGVEFIFMGSSDVRSLKPTRKPNPEPVGLNAWILSDGRIVPADPSHAQVASELCKGAAVTSDPYNALLKNGAVRASDITILGNNKRYLEFEIQGLDTAKLKRIQQFLRNNAKEIRQSQAISIDDIAENDYVPNIHVVDFLAIRKPSEVRKMGRSSRKSNPTKARRRRQPNPTLTAGDKRVITAFLSRKTNTGKVLDTDGRTLRRMWLGAEDVAIWMGDVVIEISTESTNFDQQILQYLQRAAKASKVQVVSGYGSPAYAKGLRFFGGSDQLYAGQFDGWILAYVPTLKDPVGQLDYSEYQGKFQVKMVEVVPKFRRHGVATAMYAHLFKTQGITAKDLDPSMRTPEGDAFRKGSAVFRTHRAPNPAKKAPKRKLARGYQKPEVPGDYAPRCSNYIAAALGVCIPVELTHSWHLLGALRSAGWNFEVISGKPGSWGTVRRFVKEHPKGVWAIESQDHIILVKNGKVYDYEGRGPDLRRVRIGYRLWQARSPNLVRKPNPAKREPRKTNPTKKAPMTKKTSKCANCGEPLERPVRSAGETFCDKECAKDWAHANRIQNPTLKAADKRVLDAFLERLPASGSLLESNGTDLHGIGIGSERVATWIDGYMVETSTESTKLDGTILRYLRKKHGKRMDLTFQFRSKDGHGWVTAKAAGVKEPVGKLEWSNSEVYGGKYHIHLIKVHPQFRRRGVATALYKAWMKKEGIRLSDLAPTQKSEEGKKFRKAVDKVLPNPSGMLRVFHGTTAEKAKSIASKGLLARRGYTTPGWYTVSSDIESAAAHGPYVVELLIPDAPQARKWPGYPYLWKSYWPSSKVGKDVQWWALRKKLPAEFVRKVHVVKRPNPAPVRIDEGLVKRLAAKIRNAYIRNVEKVPESWFMLEDVTFPAVGGPISLNIQVEAIPRKLMGITAAVVIRKPGKPGWLPNSYWMQVVLYGPWSDAKELLTEELERVIRHESTHVGRMRYMKLQRYESAPEAEDEAQLARYMNDPEEVEARAQEIAAGAVQAGKMYNKGRHYLMPVDDLMMTTNTWRRVREYLTEANEKLIRQKVARALSDAGIKAPGKSVRIRRRKYEFLDGLTVSILEGAAAYAGSKSANAFHTQWLRTGYEIRKIPDEYLEQRERILAAYEKKGWGKLWDASGKPTRRHLELILWQYSPTRDRLDAYVNEITSS